ncbi:transcription factor IIIB 90 kDa subunit-like [Tropilaelaps mercedesae]|uniref:B-related factor 1 n=1 Tax=Tropilaelaps mercedesae TaxID=418985 RepID=A0A1V9Y2L4_9ACAR|nr:transcription factor IIIB 90 kDa subunit-like [Tropilaelaps mercedesae]
MSAQSCRYCGATEIDVDRARGDAVCTNCGAVLEDTLIVSEVQFEETAGGGSRAVGQMVTGSGGARIQGFRYGGSKAARELTIARVRTTMKLIADQLQLNDDIVESAMRLYETALIRNFTVGRRRSHVLAACIYITCRVKESSLMLLDISDVVQVNVYELGRTYTKLAHELFINIPVLDPCIYVTRYAQKLDLAGDTHKVSLTALRLLQRMKRDWMAIGRRPSGLCGAALLIAARMHGYNRSVQDLVGIVNMSTSTIRKRLTEFAETPSGKLNLDEFETVDLEEEQDPPIFKVNKLKAKEKEDEVDPEIVAQLREYQEAIESQLDDRQAQANKRFAKYLETPSEFHKGVALSKEEEDLLSGNFIMEDTMNTIREIADVDVDDNMAVAKGLLENKVNSAEINYPVTFHDEVKPRTLVLSETDEGLPRVLPPEEREPDYVVQENDDGALDLDGIDDNEIDNYILTREESALKAKMWVSENMGFLKSEREKQIQKAKDAASGRNQKKKVKRSKKKLVRQGTPGENFQKILQEKKISKKINYDVLKNIDALLGGSGLGEQFGSADQKVVKGKLEKLDMDDFDCDASTSSFRTTLSRRKRRPAPGPEDLKQVSNIAQSLKSQLLQKRELEDDDDDLEILRRAKSSNLRQHQLKRETETPAVSADDHEEEDGDLEEVEEDNIQSASKLLGLHRGEDDYESVYVEEDFY